MICYYAASMSFGRAASEPTTTVCWHSFSYTLSIKSANNLCWFKQTIFGIDYSYENITYDAENYVSQICIILLRQIYE
jgi:hypothetical protein